MRRNKTVRAAAAWSVWALVAVGLGAGPAEIAGADPPSNACGNPVLANNINGWGSLNGAWVTRDTVGDLAGASWAFDTGGRSFYMPQVGVSAGQTWTFSATDRVVYGSGTARIAVDWYGAGGQYLGEQAGTSVALPGATAWTVVSATFSVPAGATTAHVLQSGDFDASTGTNFKATKCDYRVGSASDMASVRYNWGAPSGSQSDDYNGTAVDLAKWGFMGTSGANQTTGCYQGHNGNGQRCASQVTVSGDYLSVNGTAGGVTGGLWARTIPLRYGRVEIRERVVPGTNNGGQAYHAVPLLWPANEDYTHGEIDFAERNVGSSNVELLVHHDGTQSQCAFNVDSSQFHNYAADWRPTSVTWYVDAIQVCVVNASVTTFNTTNGGAQLDMFPPTGTLMRPARQDIDWIRMFPTAATQYQ